MEPNTQYLQKRVFIYWERINILLIMSNRDPLRQK